MTARSIKVEFIVPNVYRGIFIIPNYRDGVLLKACEDRFSVVITESGLMKMEGDGPFGLF